MRTLTAIVIMMVSSQALARQVEYIEADVVSVVPAFVGYGVPQGCA